MYIMLMQRFFTALFISAEWQHVITKFLRRIKLTSDLGKKKSRIYLQKVYPIQLRSTFSL